MGDAAADRDAVLDALDRVLGAWHGTESFEFAVAETVARTGYARGDVVRQLRHVAQRCRGATMRAVCEAELEADAGPAGGPGTVLVLASGGVPGLAIEGVAAALAVGAAALVRPSSDETVLHHLLGGSQASEPELMSRIEVVGAGGGDGGDGEVPWLRAEAAIVYGSDETIAFVRDQLTAEAAKRVAAYGSRQGIAVVTAGAERGDLQWARHLADDVLTFRQRGCMSPSWLFVLGDETETAGLVEAVGRELAIGGERHVAPGADYGLEQRRASDADVLGAIAAGLAPDPSALYAGDARLTVVRVATEPELVECVARLGTLLQTAVLATSPDDRDRLTALLDSSTSLTRICAPGQAHFPPALWPHDGLGRVAPLVVMSR